MPTTPRSDDPLANSTLNQLGDIEDPGPFVYTCKDGKTRLEFPDPGLMEWTDAEDFLEILATRPDVEALRRWLGDDDYDRFVKEGLNLRQKNLVMAATARHYHDIFGTSPEGAASAG